MNVPYFLLPSAAVELAINDLYSIIHVVMRAASLVNLSVLLRSTSELEGITVKCLLLLSSRKRVTITRLRPHAAEVMGPLPKLSHRLRFKQLYCC